MGKYPDHWTAEDRARGYRDLGKPEPGGRHIGGGDGDMWPGECDMTPKQPEQPDEVRISTGPDSSEFGPLGMTAPDWWDAWQRQCEKEQSYYRFRQMGADMIVSGPEILASRVFDAAQSAFEAGVAEGRRLQRAEAKR